MDQLVLLESYYFSIYLCNKYQVNINYMSCTLLCTENKVMNKTDKSQLSPVFYINLNFLFFKLPYNVAPGNPNTIFHQCKCCIQPFCLSSHTHMAPAHTHRQAQCSFPCLYLFSFLHDLAITLPPPFTSLNPAQLSRLSTNPLLWEGLC